MVTANYHGFVTSNNNIHKVLYIYIFFFFFFFCGYKNKPKPTTAFRMTTNALYKNNAEPCWKKTIEPSQKILTLSQMNHKYHYKHYKPSIFNH